MRVKVAKKSSSLHINIAFSLPLIPLPILVTVGMIVLASVGFYFTRDFLMPYQTPTFKSADSLEKLHRLHFLTALEEDEKIPPPPFMHPAPPPPPQLPLIVFNGSRDQKLVAITFDADMTYGMQEMLANGEVPTLYDDRLIQILTETNTKATLFLSGLWIETYPEESKALAQNPLFELASHSYSHPSFAGDCYGLGEIPDSENEDELGKTQDLLRNLTGKENKLFRFPGGCYSDADLASLRAFGLTAIQWDVEAHDGFNPEADTIRRNILDHVQNGSIIVMHMNGGTNELHTADLMPEIIQTLHDRGFTFVTVSELLQQHPFAPPIIVGKYSIQ